jgi:hypothetical protein
MMMSLSPILRNQSHLYRVSRDIQGYRRLYFDENADDSICLIFLREASYLRCQLTHATRKRWYWDVLLLRFWSCCNVTAPNLTSMADDYGFLTETSRDWYLGSVLAIVQTIASLPVAAVLGLLTDIADYRQKLFVAILIVGALSSALGALSSNSYQLLVLSRWLSSGCRTGSVPVAFFHCCRDNNLRI